MGDFHKAKAKQLAPKSVKEDPEAGLCVALSALRSR
jgi:hypothetical protein